MAAINSNNNQGWIRDFQKRGRQRVQPCNMLASGTISTASSNHATIMTITIKKIKLNNALKTYLQYHDVDHKNIRYFGGEKMISDNKGAKGRGQKQH